MNWKNIHSFLLAIVLIINANQNVFAQHTSDSAEDLWATLDFISIKKSILAEATITNQDKDLYVTFLDKKFTQAKFNFFNLPSKTDTAFNVQNFSNNLIASILSDNNAFEIFKKEYVAQQKIFNTLSFNGPCDNIDFESGTTNGWQGFTAQACESPTPCNIVSGFSATQHQIMTPTMVDPYIPTLPVVAPGGGNYSLRLENYLNGGNATLLRQTFLVTPTNNIFTYQYAAVLEDPGDHRDLERPYFKVRMYAADGSEITCATYTAIAKPPIQNFIYARVANPNYDPNNQRQRNQFMDLYYRKWTTITIPLLGYVGQNVTVEFIASDCSRGGHLGYAYIDANCSFLDTSIPPTICGGENVTLYGPKDFASYLWSGPGIIGSKTSKNAIANKSGVYQIKLTPVADNPCPITVQTVVPERCIPVPISVKACETVKGSGKKKAIDLTSYNTPITAYSNLASVIEWHSAKPANATNVISNPQNVDVTNGSKYYAIIKYSTVGSDTAELNFVINSTPNITLSDINPMCKNNTAVQISGASPTGGIFSGTNITTSGMFTPTVGGTTEIKYTYTNSNGCIDSIKKSIVVNLPPTLTISNPQNICATATSIDLTATAANQTTVVWGGGNGRFTNNQNLITTYNPSTTELNSSSITLSLKVNGITPCPYISQNIVINIIPLSTVNAGIDQDICLPIRSPIQLVGTSTNSTTDNWRGASNTFSNANTLRTSYNPTLADTQAGSVILTLTSTAQSPCPQNKDSVEIRFHKPPIANAGPDKIVCSGVTVSLETALIPQIAYKWESIYGVSISSTNTATVLANKDSNIVLKLKNQFGCIDSDTMSIVAFNPPVYNLGGPYCMSNSLILDAHPVIADPLLNTPVWYKDTVAITGENQSKLYVTMEGHYTIVYKQGECKTTASTDIYVNPVLVTPKQSPVCEQKNITLTTSNIPSATYTWTKNGQVIGSNSSTISTVVTKGISKYIVSVIDQHTCKTKDSVTIEGIPNPILSLKDTSICDNNSIILNGTPLNMFELSNYSVTYKWYYNTNELTKNISNVIQINNSGKYSLVAFVNQCSNTTSMNLSLIPLPVLVIQSPRIICPESDKEIILDAGKHSNYIWQPTGETTKDIIVNKGGIYTVQVFNNSNCTVSGAIEVKEVCPPRLFVGNAFSPNRDGVNDLFNVYGVHIGSYKLLIFNRWGEIIFESLDKDHFWDGYYKGELMPIGVYPWTIVYEGDSKEYLGPYKLEGSVTIIK
jgi:gliding motility-associated-like protein